MAATKFPSRSLCCLGSTSWGGTSMCGLRTGLPWLDGIISSGSATDGLQRLPAWQEAPGKTAAAAHLQTETIFRKTSHLQTERLRFIQETTVTSACDWAPTAQHYWPQQTKVRAAMTRTFLFKVAPSSCGSNLHEQRPSWGFNVNQKPKEKKNIYPFRSGLDASLQLCPCSIWEGKSEGQTDGDRRNEASVNPIRSHHWITECHWTQKQGHSSISRPQLWLNYILDLKHRLTSRSNNTVRERGEKKNASTKLQINQGFKGTCWTGKQSCGWTGQPSRLALQRWRLQTVTSRHAGFYLSSKPRPVTLRPLKKLKTAAKGKLPWPSPRREAQVKLCGRIQLYSPAHNHRRPALIKASVNRSKQHISVWGSEGLPHGCRVFGGSLTWVQKWFLWAERGSSFQSLSA